MAFGNHLIEEEQQPENKKEPLIFKILKVRFISPNNNFFIAEAETKTNKGFEKVNLKGNMADFNDSWVNKELECSGEFYEDNWGKGFKATLVTPVMPRNANTFVKFFNNKVSGVGQSTLEKISKKYGEEATDILSCYPEELLEFMDMDKAQNLFNFWQKEKRYFDVKVFLSKNGLNELQISNVMEFFGQKLKEKIKEDPYNIMEVDGVGFKSADFFARSLGTALDAPIRIRAAIKHFLIEETEKEGSTLIERGEFIKKVRGELMCSNSIVEKCIENLANNDYIKELTINEGQANGVYFILSKMYEHEYNIAKSSNRILNSVSRPVKGISFSKKWLDDQQKKAVETSFENKLSIITGGPGTGKTSIISEIVGNCQRNKLSIKLMAPTGKAAKRMEESTGMVASTIHRAYSYSPDGGFGVNEHNTLKSDVVIVDECSMVDTALMSATLKGISPGSRVVLVGDIDQLPSVGPGEVFKNMIESEAIPVSRLENTYRQSHGSGIIEASKAINKGKMPELNSSEEDEFCFINKEHNDEIIYQEVEAQVKNLIKKGVKKEDIQIITPQWGRRVGVNELNESLKYVYNPNWHSHDPKSKMNIIEGDRVMQTKNDAKKEIYNGDVGFVETSDLNYLDINFGKDELTRIKKDEMKNIMLSYAYTVHKSQGSEIPYVIMPLSRSHTFTLNKEVLYTAVSRAKEKFIMIGVPETLKKSLKKSNGKRKTNLNKIIKDVVSLDYQKKTALKNKKYNKSNLTPF